MSAIIRIAACSYEGSLFGWDVSEEGVEMEEMEGTKDRALITKKKQTFSVPQQLVSKINMVFGFHVSRGSFKAVAISKSGKYLAIGGMDERIHIFNMHENRAVGEIAGHTGAITSLLFYGDNFLISGSEDHTMYIWRVHDWQHLHILGGHKDTVLDFAVHPSGKIALSISKDHTMKLWNLVQGRCSFTRRLRGIADYIFWHPNGDYYMLVTTSEVQMFAVSDNSCTFEMKSKSRINHATFIKIADTNDLNNDYRIVYICDNQTINMVDMTGKLTTSLAIASIGIGRLRTVCTCSSHGLPKIDLVEDDKSLQSECLVLATSTGCIAVLNGYLLEQKDFAAKGNKVDDVELAFGQALYAFDQVRADPRFTAVVAWNTTVIHQKGSSHANSENDELVPVEEVAPESGSDESEEEEKEVAPQKKGNQGENNQKDKPVKAEKKKVKFHKEVVVAKDKKNIKINKKGGSK